jgi:hypothetical protein
LLDAVSPWMPRAEQKFVRGVLESTTSHFRPGAPNPDRHRLAGYLYRCGCVPLALGLLIAGVGVGVLATPVASARMGGSCGWATQSTSQVTISD